MKTEIKVRIGLEEHPGYTSTMDMGLKDYETNQITELYIDSSLEFVSINQVMEILAHWTTKLRKGGLIIISGTDLIQVSKRILTKEFKIPQVNNLLFNNRQCCLTLDDVTSLLENLKLKIITKRLNDIQYIVTAERT